MANEEPSKGDRKNDLFTATSWTLVMAAQGDSSEAIDALNRLCNTYWYPLYAFARHKGHAPHDAEDITQGFFHQIIHNKSLGAADRSKGKFRAFLLTAFKGYMINRYHFDSALKRGGGKTILSLDVEPAEQRYSIEPTSNLTPERLFERHWARTVLEQVHKQLEFEMHDAGKQEFFEKARVFLSEGTRKSDYRDLAQELDMTPNALAVAVHRLRQRYRKLLTEEIGRLVGSPEEVEPEMRHLHAVLAEV